MKNQKVFYTVAVRVGRHVDCKEGLTLEQAQREEQRLWKNGYDPKHVKTFITDCTRYDIRRDVNGNKCCLYRPAKGKAFSVQTNDNMPETHRLGINPETPQEFAEYISSCGTDYQRDCLNV